MGQDNRINRLWIDRKRLPVSNPELLVALEQPTIDQDSPRAGLNKIFGARDGSSGSEKRKLKHLGPILHGRPCRQYTYSRNDGE